MGERTRICPHCHATAGEVCRYKNQAVQQATDLTSEGLKRFLNRLVRFNDCIDKSGRNEGIRQSARIKNIDSPV